MNLWTVHSPTWQTQSVESLRTAKDSKTDGAVVSNSSLPDKPIKSTEGDAKPKSQVVILFKLPKQRHRSFDCDLSSFGIADMLTLQKK